MQQLRDLARRLLAEGTVGVVIGYEEGPRGVRPAFVTRPEDADRLVFDHRSVQNLASYLNPRRRHVRALGKAAVVVKGCDAAAVAALVRESQLARDEVVLIGVHCAGVARAEDVPSLDATTLADRCVGCTLTSPTLADHVVGAPRPLPAGAIDRRAARIARLEAGSPAERWEFWRTELARCTRCHACREVCPVCFCDRCVADKSRPQWIESSPHGRGNLAWQISRMLHVSGRCVGCNECERACPSAIPLGLLTSFVAGTMARRFDHHVTADPSVAAPIGAWRADDAQEFIR